MHRGNAIIAVVLGIFALIFFVFAIIYYAVFGQLPTLDKPTGSSGTGNGVCANIPEPYLEIFTAAGKKFVVKPEFIAAIFVGEHPGIKDTDYKTWPNSTGPWANSPKGASGPFQFMPETWNGHQQDGDGDGKIDIQNLADSAFAAAHLLANIGAGGNTSDEARLKNAASKYNSGRAWDTPGRGGLRGQDIPETKRYVEVLVIPSFQAFLCQGGGGNSLATPGRYGCPLDPDVAKGGANWGDVLSQKNYRTGTYSGHEGLDIGAAVGSTVNSVSNGKVVRAGKKPSPPSDPSYSNNRVWVEERPGVYWYYTHLTDISVREGQQVLKGQKIGTSGFARTAHLHIGIANRLGASTTGGYKWDSWYYPYEFLRFIPCTNPPAGSSVGYPSL